MLGAVALPATWPSGEDGFPLSSYPMFARRPRARAAIVTVVGVTPGGVSTPLTPELIAGAPWVNLAGRVVRERVKKGPRAAESLCRTVAERVAAAALALEHIEVVTESFDTIAAIVDSAPPRGRKVHARCPVRP